MTRKSLLGLVALAAMTPALYSTPADAIVDRVTLIEEFGFFT
ncbi:MAG TPA: hypothetical protein VKU85_19290 [bacterium]|nr:hypothetical protein [bacterium]